MNNRKFGRSALVMSLALGAMPLAAGAASAADKIKVAISSRGLWPALVSEFAEEQGINRTLGLEASFVGAAGGNEPVQALATKSVDFACSVGIQGVIAAFAKGAPVHIIGSSFTGTSDVFWYVRADSPVKDVKDLTGKTVGYSRPGSTGHQLILKIAERYNVKPVPISSGAFAATRTQVMSGQIDVGWSSPPFALDTVRKGEARIVMRGDIMPEMQNQTVRVCIAHGDTLKNNRDLAARFMRGYSQALDWMYTAKEEATRSFAKHAELSLDDAKDAIAFYDRKALEPAPIGDFDKTVAEAVELKFIDRPLSPDQARAIVDLVYDPRKP
jgi:NitT/TauT family transport system substrate-binding protein